MRNISTRLIAYGSDQTHSSFKKATKIANTRYRALPTGSNFSLCGETVKREIEKDTANGLIPFFVVGTIGTTNSAAIDELVDIADAIKDTKVWLHVDAAYAGSFLICPEYKYLLEGVNRADSFNLNMHKVFLTNFDCSCLWIKDRNYLIRALSVPQDIIKYCASESELVFDYKDWQIPFGRKFRALKVWFTLRAYGAKGLREHIRKRIILSQRFCNKLEQYPELFVISPRPSFALTCFHIKSNDGTLGRSNEFTEMICNKLNESGKVLLTQVRINEQNSIRFVPGSPLTTEKHVDKAFELLLNITKEVISFPIKNHVKDSI